MGKTGVVGGGASGLMAAICAAQQGENVTVLESRDRIGKKYWLPATESAIFPIGIFRSAGTTGDTIPTCSIGISPGFVWRIPFCFSGTEEC